jgi:cholest-4-en-3-one 26-monooxygenase
MKIPDIDLNDLETFEAGIPHEWFRRLRKEAPVYWHDEPDGPGYWVVTKYEDLRYVSTKPQIFSSFRGGTNIFDLDADGLTQIQSLLINMDPPQHVKHRRLVQKGFTPRQVKPLEPRIRELCGKLIDQLVHRDECELVADLAAELPMQVICELVGVPFEDRHLLYDLSNRLIGFDDPDFATSPEDGKIAAAEMYAYAQKLGAERRENPEDDLVTKLVTAEVDGKKLTDHEFNSFFLLLVLAGNETTRTATTHGVNLLARYPEQRQRLKADPSLLSSAVEEFLRFESPLIHFRRTATQDTEIRGIKIREGDKVTIWYPSANRDEEIFPDADTFDIGRTPNPHVAFGIGEHFCLGSNLARLELNIIFEELLGRLPEIQLAGEPRRVRSNFINAIKHMPVRFGPTTP